MARTEGGENNGNVGKGTFRPVDVALLEYDATHKRTSDEEADIREITGHWLNQGYSQTQAHLIALGVIIGPKLKAELHKS